MTTKVHFLLVLLLPFGNIFSQPDTLHSGIYRTDTLWDDTTECYPYKCSITKCNTWYIGIEEGVIHVTGDPADFYEITITTYNDSVHFDTCVTLFPFAGGDFLMFFTFGQNAQITICGPEGSAITIIAKPDTSQPHPPLKPPFLCLDTLCGATSIEPQHPTTTYYYERGELARAGIGGRMPKAIRREEFEPNAQYVKAGRIYEH